MPSDARIVRRVLWIAVPEVILHGAQIRALVGQVVAATVAQHVRPDPAKLRRLARHPDDVVHGLAGELRLTLGDEEPGQIVLAGGEVAFKGAEFVASDRLLDRELVLEASHPYPGALDIDGIAPHLGGLAHAQTVAVATPCCPAPVSAMMRFLPIRRASRACPRQLLILCAPVCSRSSRLR